MKLKDVFLGVLIVALIASEILLFSANQQKRDALAKLKATQNDLQQAQTELQQTKDADAAALASVKTDNQTLLQKNAQLTKQNKSLQTDNDKLSQQLGTEREAAQLQQQHLEQMQTQAEQQIATTPATTAASAEADREACVTNLRTIQAAKVQWAADLSKTLTDTPTEQDLLVYLPGGTFPVCASGGTYTINAVGVAPSCSVHGQMPSQ